jgi:hypothetical protein
MSEGWCGREDLNVPCIWKVPEIAVTARFETHERREKLGVGTQ